LRGNHAERARIAVEIADTNGFADMTPRRIQRKRTRGWRMPEGAVYVGRPSRWGNPYKVGAWVRNIRSVATELPAEVKTNEQAVALFLADTTHPTAGFVFRENVRRELRGKDLACWCRLDQACHADVLLKVANS
jgi:hypothetical protein